MLIFYFVGAVLSKKCQSEELKKVKKERFVIERGFSKEGRIKSARNAFTLLFYTSLFNFVQTTVSLMLERGFFRNLF